GSYAYDDSGGRFSSFLVAESGGRWRKVDDLAGDGDVNAISCSPAGNFVAGVRKLEHFADPEIVGSWVDSVACPTAGNCAAVGAYLDKSQKRHGFVAVERNGSWAKATEVPGLGKRAEVYSVS